MGFDIDVYFAFWSRLLRTFSRRKPLASSYQPRWELSKVLDLFLTCWFYVEYNTATSYGIFFSF